MKSIIEWTAAEIEAAKLSKANLVNIRMQEIAKLRRSGMWSLQADKLTLMACKRLKKNGILESISREQDGSGNLFIKVSAL